MRRHPEVELSHVQETLADPDYICGSETQPGDWTLAGEGFTNDYGDGLRVAVRYEHGQTFVTSAYYVPYTPGVELWRRGDG